MYVDPAVNHDDGDDDGDDDFSFQEGELLAQWADNIHFLFLLMSVLDCPIESFDHKLEHGVDRRCPLSHLFTVHV